MSNTFEMVREFHEKFGHPVKTDGADVTALDERTKALRIALIEEELGELREAVAGDDTVEVADALADLAYVINGFALVAGIDLPEVTREVHRSNMSKLGADGKPIYREDGKILKGPDYFRPDIAAVLSDSDIPTSSN